MSLTLSPVPAPRPTRVWLARAVALLLLSFGAGAVTSIAPSLVTVAHSSDDTPSEVEAEKAEEAEEALERAAKLAEEQAEEHEYAVAPVPLSARTAQAPAPAITRDAATLAPARQAAQSIKAGTTTTTTSKVPAKAPVAAASPPGPPANRAPVQEPGTPISAPVAALPGLTLAADSSPARQAEGKVTSAAPSVVGEPVSLVLYVGGAGLLLLLALYGAAYRGARSLRLPSD